MVEHWSGNKWVWIFSFFLHFMYSLEEVLQIGRRNLVLFLLEILTSLAFVLCTSLKNILSGPWSRDIYMAAPTSWAPLWAIRTCTDQPGTSVSHQDMHWQAGYQCEPSEHALTSWSPVWASEYTLAKSQTSWNLPYDQLSINLPGSNFLLCSWRNLWLPMHSHFPNTYMKVSTLPLSPWQVYMDKGFLSWLSI